MELWFGDDDFAVVGYVTRVGVRVAAGAPVCHPRHLSRAVESFESDATKRNEQVCWFGAEARLEELLRERGDLALVPLGAQPVWDPREWRSRIDGLASVRAQLNRSRNKGVKVTEWPSQRGQTEPELHACLREWLDRRGLPPLHFLVESRTLDRLADRRLFVAAQGAAIVGFAVASPVPARGGWLLEQVVRRPSAPNGTAELLIDTAVTSLASGGANYLTLGLVPLSRQVAYDQPWWLRTLLLWVRAHGRRFYDFQGLEFFKSKFRPPEWEPIYAIGPGRHASPRTLYAVAAAFSHGPPPLMLGRALLAAVGQEVTGLARLTRRRQRGR